MFIPHFATKAEPLMSLTKKEKPENVQWTSREQQSFKIIEVVQMLVNPNFSQLFQLQTDASNVGVRAALSQGGDNDRPIAYFS